MITVDLMILGSVSDSEVVFSVLRYLLDGDHLNRAI